MRDRLKRALDWDATPTLTEDDIDDVILMAARVDEFGFPPTDPMWEETFDFDLAAYEGWGRKAAKAASMVDFTADDTSIKRSQYLQFCKDMQQRYASRMSYSMTVGRNRVGVGGTCYRPMN